MSFVGIALVLAWTALAFGAWFVFHLLQQNGRTLLRVEALEADVEWLAAKAAEPGATKTGGDTLAKSRINRNGLPPGTTAPAFTLPRLDGGELSLSDYTGRPVLLVFSDPDCGPCDALAPKLERIAQQTPGMNVVMVSRGDAERNRSKVAAHGLTFPVVLQDQWKLSREYAKFATPIGSLIDEEGRIAADVALGLDAILALPSRAKAMAAAGR